MRSLLMRTVGIAALSASLMACEQASETAQVEDDAQITDDVLAEVEAQVAGSAPVEVTAPSATMGDWGIETQNISETVAPGDDFYTYVNEGFLETAEFRPGYPSAGGFLDLHLESQEQVRAIIEDASSSTDRTHAEQQVGDIYASFMNRELIEELGLLPIQEELDAVLASTTHEEIARWMGRPVHSSVVGLYISPDAGDPTQYTTWLYQSGLNLPERSYYLEDDERFAAFRAAYVDYMEATFTRAGIDRPRERAEAVMAFETAIAEVHWTPEAARDRVANYKPKSLEELAEYAPGFAWQAFFEELEIADQPQYIAQTDSALQGIGQVMAETPVDTLASYLAFNFIDNQSAFLPEAYDTASWEFYSRTLRGVEEQRPMDQRGVSYTSGSMGEVIGQVYVDRYFPQSSKDTMEELVGYLTSAYEASIGELDWMDEETRVEALAKLEAFTPKIGFPDRWRDYASIEIDAGDVIGNARRIGAWSWDDSRSRLGGPIRDWEWGMSPQTVNAYYSPTRNEIVFPAAILQAPFFDPNADMAVNFGAIGGVIGHEIGHGFDDQGSRTDGTGLLRDWWTEASRAAFEERTSRLIAQYSAFEPVEGYNLNGELTLGENIGDLGGLSIALEALAIYEADHGELPDLDGFTAEQRVFFGWAQAFRVVRSEDSLISRIEAGPHSPGPYRVNGVVRNIDAWYDAFGITEDNALYLPPEERVSIW